MSGEPLNAREARRPFPSRGDRRRSGRLARPVRRRRGGAGSHRAVAVRSRRNGPPRAQAIAAFYDTVIAPSEKITFEITASYLCGDEVADVGVIRTTLAGGTHQAVVKGVYTYRTNGEGKLAALRAFWEFDALEMIELGS